MESEAVLAVLRRGQTGLYQIIGSDILELEMNQMRDIVKRTCVKELYKAAAVHGFYTEETRKRSQEIMKQSKIRTFDSLHIALAEALQADVLLTTDDKLEKMAAKLELKVKVMNPLKFMWEEI